MSELYVPEPPAVPVPDAAGTDDLAGPSAWRQFLDFTGGSILYCLSALSIIYGIARLLGPLLTRTDALAEALPCIGALGVYELALLGVLVTIVVWRGVKDDAISLVVLVALFLVGTSVALTTVVNSGPDNALYIGLGCAGLGIAKLYTMRRFVRLDIGVFSFVGASVILVSTFLVGPSFAKSLAGLEMGEITRHQWLLGWLGILVGGALTVADTRSRQPGDDDRLPFLNGTSMRLIFLSILLVAVGVHQYVVAYIFDIRFIIADYLPLIAVVSLLALRLCHNLREQPGHLEPIVACIPLIACGYAVVARSVAPCTAFWIDLLWHPAVLLGITGSCAVWLHARRHGYVSWLIAVPYVLGVVLWGRVWSVFKHMSGWDYVVLSFVLLFVGAWVSIRKGQRRECVGV